MSTKGRENWEKYKAGYVSTRLAEEVSTGNAGRDSWNELKKTIRFDKPESTQDVVSGSGAQKDKKFDAGQYAEDAGKLFLNGLASLAQTGAMAEDQIGKVLDKLFPGAGFEGSGLFNVLYNGRPDWKWAGENGLVGIKQDTEYNMERIRENAERTDSKLLQKAAEFGGDTAYALGNALPMAVEAALTGGASAAAALTKGGLLKKGAEVVEKSGVLNSISQAARDMLTSRDYWTSFASEVGMDYYDALDSGATEDEALRYALSSAGLNSIIEIGGGIQKIPEKPTFRTWLKSAHEEGMEEIQQGVVSRLLENVVYNKGNPIASVTDENAVLNPVTALGEYAGGAAVGGILSGGQQLTQTGINKVVEAKQKANRNAVAKVMGSEDPQALVKESLELNPDNALATKLQKKLEAGKRLTGSELRQLVEQNEIDMVDGDRATIQTAAEARLTELGETENVPQVAEAIARQAAGERITDAEKTLLEGSERARQVRQELNPENIRVGATDEAWTGQIGTARVNRAAYNRGIQENGVTGAKYNAETGKLDAIVKDDQGKIQTVPAEKAELSPLQEELFDWATDLGEAGPVLVSAYRQPQTLETYARQFHNAYEYGKAGVPMDYVNKSQAVSYLNTTQREIAYEEGAKAHQRELQGRQERKRPGGTVDTTAQKKPTVSLRGATVGGIKYAPVNKKAMDGRQWASVGTMKAFARATGVNVVFYESQANERGEYEGANGFYKNGTLYLDINAGRDRVAMGETAILKTAAHEITHYIKEGSPEQYEVLKNFVVEKLTREKGISFDDLVTDKQRREPGLSYEEAVDEVVADACEMMLKDSKAVEQLARENRSLAERIRQWIRKWVRSLKAAMEGLTADRPESRAMMQYAQELQEIWDNALVDAVRNGRGTVQENAPAEVKQQARVGTDEKSGKPIYQSNFPKGTPKAAKAQRILSLIQNVWSKKPISLVVQNADGSTRTIEAKFDPTYIEEEGVQTDAKKLMGGNRHGSASEQRVTLDLADDYYEIAAESTYNYSKSEMGKTSPTHKGVKQWHYFINDILFQEYGEKETTPYRVTINVKERSDGEFVYSFSAERQNERLSTRRTLHADDTQSARGGESNAQPSVDSIRQGNANSQVKSNDKVQNSMRDSVGRELTEAQQEYFKDSKVRDADGKLKPVYHGSAAIFTKFSADFMSQNGSSEGQGFYFTDYKPMAQGYEKNGGQLLEGYLDIKKPLSDSEVTLTAAEVKQLIKAVDPTGDDLVLNYDSRGGIGYPSRAWYNRSVEDTLRATMSTSESDSEILAELANGMGNPGKVLKTVRELLGYDGYIVESKYDNATVYVAFDSSQFKNADNKTPTTDPDIRFQQREPRLSDRAVLEWAAEMALRDKNKSWTAEDREQLERFRNRMRMLQDTQAELEALKEERKVLLAGRKVSEITGEERTEVSKNKNRIDIAKNKAERYEAEVWELESKAAIKKLLKKSRSIVEADAADTARKRYREQRYESQRKAVERRKAARSIMRLAEYMNTNSDKKHIPEALKVPVGELLKSLNLSSAAAQKGTHISQNDSKYFEAMSELKNVLEKQKAYEENRPGGEDVLGGYPDLPVGFETMLAEHIDAVKKVVEGKPLKTDIVQAMDLDDLKDLNVILSVISTSVKKMNQMFVNNQFKFVADAAENSVYAMEDLGQHNDKIKPLQRTENQLLWDNTLPYYAFQRFGLGGRAVFEGLMDGQDKLAFNMRAVLDFRESLPDLISDATIWEMKKWDATKTISDKKMHKLKNDYMASWSREMHTVKLMDEKGHLVDVELSTGQIIDIYWHSKRKQSLGHIFGDGIRPSAVKLKQKDKKGSEKLLESKSRDEHFKVSPNDLTRILNRLTPDQIKVAEAMQKFMTEQGSVWGNEISMIRHGYRAFTEEFYVPDETDSQDRAADLGDNKEGSLYRLQNISAVKKIKKNATNALVIRDAFDVFTDHMADMAKYNALVLPIIDAQRWYNYRYPSKNGGESRNVKRAMTKAYGKSANDFVVTFLRDLNGVKESSDRGTSKTERATSFYKRTAVAANFRVAVLQTTAYVRASFALDYKYLAKAFLDKTGTAQAKKEMLENSGIAQWKKMGFFDTNVGRSVRDKIRGDGSKVEDLVDKTMKPAELGDEVTWARLWRACKLEVQDKQHLTGEELLEETARRFREVVYQTQVVDSTMTRSHNMRAGSAWAKTVTAFMSEPTVSYNMVMESTRKTAEDAKRMGMRVAVKRNRKILVRAFQAYVLTEVASAIIESLTDAFRDPDDDPFLEKFWTAFWGEKPESFRDAVLGIVLGTNGNLVGNLNPLGKIPLLKDALSALSGEDVSRMDMEALTNTYKALAIWDETIRLETGELDKATKTTYYGNMTTYGKLYQTSKALSQLSGLPVSSAAREVATWWNNSVGIPYPELKARTYEDKQLREAWENYGKASGVSYAVMYRAIQDLKEFESDRDADGNAISGSLKAKYVEYIRRMGLTRAQEKAVWEAAKNSSWSDKGTPWG